MKKTITFTTIHDHHYIYSPFRNQILFCHPLVSHFKRIDTGPGCLHEFINGLSRSGSTTIDGTGTFTNSEIRYQYRKYNFLKKHQYFKTPAPQRLGGRLPATLAQNNISTIKQVIFETTEACNLSCTYCTYSKFYINRKPGSKKFNPESARAFLEYVLANRSVTEKNLIVSFYGGEPLKNIRFIRDIVEYLITNHSGTWTFRFTMSTNGLLLAKYADFLVEHNFDISVSLDGDEKGNSFRVLHNNQASYPIVVKNLDFLQANFPVFFNDHVTFLTVLHSRNNFKDVLEFFKKRYGKTSMTSMINTLNVNRDFVREFNDTFINHEENEQADSSFMHEIFLEHPRVREFATVTENYSGIVFKNHFQVLSRINGDAGPKEFIPTATCQPFGMRVYLTADGSVVPCEHISRNFEIGSFNNASLNIDYQLVVKTFNQGYDKIQPLCKTCFIAENCKECLFNTRIEGEQPACDYYLDQAGFEKYLARNYSLMEEDPGLHQKILEKGFDENS